ncbi:MAG: ChaN family lipoprotein [Oligoflexia bacterium]|nr:ChaN family lipoprotein [Oligoflexia bacterium]
MKTTDRRHLLQLQRRIFRSLRAESRRLLGPQPESIVRYEREFERDFRAKRPLAIAKPELVRAVRAADVTFVADFHTFEQAQRTALRVLREAARPGENWIVGLELVSTRQQRELDDFQAGRISLEEFQRAIHYQEEWGFPWRNYAPLFQWARENDVRLIALNRPPELRALLDRRGQATRSQPRDGTERDLDKRDRWAAGVITDLFASAARAKTPPRLLVLYGELHVATAHLPRALQSVSRQFLGEPLSSIVIHQNHDGLYWKLARAGKENRSEILQLRKGLYCVLSGTPWAKLQSLVSWAEGLPGEGDAVAETDDEDGGEPTPVDYLSLMKTFGETLSELLGLKPVSWSGLQAWTIEQADFAHGFAHRDFTPWELRLLRSHVVANRRFYLPGGQLAYLGSPSINYAAELAAIHLLRQGTRTPGFVIHGANDYFRQALDAAFGFFGSLLINPRRKCDLPQDHARILRENRARSGAKLDQLARQLALESLRPGFAERPLPAKSAFPKAGAPASRKLEGALRGELAARYAGHIVGKRLHLAFLSGRASAADVREVFFPSEPAPHAERYARLLRLVAPAKAPRTKAESL